MAFDFKAHGKQFETILGEGHEYYVKVKVNLLRKMMLEEKLNLPMRALDVGCGTGIAEEFFGAGTDGFVGIDTAESMLRIAKERRTHAEYLCADGSEMPFVGGTFDLVFSFALMHHLEPSERLGALGEIARVTKRGGYVFTFEHNPTNPLVRRIVRQCIVDQGVQLIRSVDMVRLHSKAGLRVVDVKYLAFFPRLLSFFEPIDSALHPVPLGGQYVVAARKPGPIEDPRV